MRKDMSKVIVERPRFQDYWSSKPKRKTRPKGMSHEDLDELPRYENMKRQKGGTKQLNEFLSPLKRYLHSQVGRPWNTVYSEIRENLNLNSAVQYHVIQHMWDYIHKDTFMKDGKVWVCSFGYRTQDVPLEQAWASWRDLYIHPKDGMLKLIPKPKPKNREKKVERVDGPMGPKGFPDYQYHKLDGIWYRATLAKLQGNLIVVKSYTDSDGKRVSYHSPTFAGLARDVLLKGRLYQLDTLSRGRKSLSEMYGYKDVYCNSIKQLSKKELKKAGLKNDLAE